MGGTAWILWITLPGPDVGAVEHLTGLLQLRTGAVGITGGTKTMSVGYPDEASAREAMDCVLAERPDARCSVQVSPPPNRRVACPTCEGTGQQLPADGRTCVMCDGSGLVTADAAKTIVESEEMEVDPPGDG
jgi:hypothetical protein